MLETRSPERGTGYAMNDRREAGRPTSRPSVAASARGRWTSGRRRVLAAPRLPAVAGWAAVGLLFLLAGCRHFDPRSYQSTDALFRDSMREFRAGRFRTAAGGFQKLTLDLAARDTLQTLAQYLLAECHFGQQDYATAAREFRRVADEHPADRLAPGALLRAGDAYALLWRRPALDPANGLTALAAYQELQGRYPDGEAASIAALRLRALHDDFATKEFENALFYFRRGAYDSAILYLKNLIASYPSATVVPEAFVRLVRAYRAIGYREEEEETCAHLRQYYGTRADVRDLCGDGRLRR